MRLISPLGLKQSIAVNAILETGKCLEDIIDDEPSVDPVHVAGGCYCRECTYATRPRDNIVHCDNFERDMMLDDYCSVGTKKEAAHD